ncbi:MAG: 3-phosphoshikimate 1-carboxyvinyltransferase [Lachnospiraceae bacterium]|jgi:3-phosphoshikimate 1-carboxyvinyltransferase|nr:3-phosphoshikimate 1-carboxyvinyltransferase [Lachnospiraceae bacterium]RKJ51092.1 3-phosphoshikimate 1-carboxyvinyltransferase [bacterium 1XD42-54]
MIVRSKGPLRGELTVPGDKSISHRSIMFGALADGMTEVTNFLTGADCLSTISCFRQMGIEVQQNGSSVKVFGKGIHGLKAPEQILYAGNSGTTVRLMSGILAGQAFSSSITGDTSIQKRPMKRIMTPLSMMQADISSVYENGCAPLSIHGKSLKAIDYKSPVASAQVKSCVLLAGLYADDITSVTEPVVSRNHSELMLRYFGADVNTKGTTASICPDPPLTGQKICVPGDISSAAYFIAAALLVPGSEVLLKNVGINPTRDGLLRVCRAMGGDITYVNENHSGAEPCADILVRSSSLQGVVIEGDIIPTLIDELPVLAVLGACADGTTVIRDAAELKVKESDRIAVMTENLKRIGCDVTATDDGMIIQGGKALHGASIDTKKDHRIAMSFAVAALACDGEMELLDGDCVNISYPGFYQDLERLSR